MGEKLRGIREHIWHKVGNIVFDSVQKKIKYNHREEEAENVLLPVRLSIWNGVLDNISASSYQYVSYTNEKTRYSRR